MASVKCITIPGAVRFVSLLDCAVCQVLAPVSAGRSEMWRHGCLWFFSTTICDSTWSPYYSRLRFSFPYTWLCGNPHIARYLHLAPVFPTLLEAVGLFVMHLQMNLDFFPVSLLLHSIFMTLRSPETLTAANTANQIILQIRSRVRNSLQFSESEIKKALHSCRWAPLLS